MRPAKLCTSQSVDMSSILLYNYTKDFKNAIHSFYGCCLAWKKYCRETSANWLVMRLGKAFNEIPSFFYGRLGLKSNIQPVVVVELN